jgi:hypothetical protein
VNKDIQPLTIVKSAAEYSGVVYGAAAAAP